MDKTGDQKKIREIYDNFSAAAVNDCHISRDSKVLAAVSGGADSVCLFLMLKAFLAPGNLGAAHFNHLIRGEESDRDEKFVRELAERSGVPFYCGKKDIPALAAAEQTGTEECARKYRYEFLRETAIEKGYEYIATAHNSGDNAETVLMHILRGCSVDGLAGIAYSDGMIVRPMLRISRKSIEQYLEAAEQPYVTDSTNSDNSFLRNRLRNEIIPYLNKQTGYDIEAVLTRQTEIAAEEKDYLDSSAEAFIKEHVSSIDGALLLDTESFLELHTAVARRVIRSLIANVKNRKGIYPYAGRKDIGSDTVGRVLKLIRSGKKGRGAECGRGITVKLSHSGAVFSAWDNETTCFYEYPDNSYSVHFFSDEESAEMIKNGRIKATEDTIYFDKEKYISIINKSGGKDPVMRVWQPEDSIVPFGMEGRKKIRKLLMDKKVPSEKRNTVRVLAVGNDILWIPGICSSAKLAITAESGGIAEIRINRNNGI